ncbi:MAG: DEAD/DEAH box helicase family protein [Saprospiraceae bacterium]|nr:DEAD/DEAH box helicase family protein [Saprospiraceae bacterium]
MLEGLRDIKNEAIKLYDYQLPVTEKLMDFVEKNSRRSNALGYVVMPGGSGKTIIFSDFVRRLNERAIILSPTLTISDQNIQSMREMNPDLKISVYTSEERDLSGDVIYTTYHSLLRLLKRGDIGRDFARVIIFDEGHRSLSKERSQIPSYMNALCIAFTATDKFSEEKSVEKIFENEIYRLSLREAIETGILLPIRGFIVKTNIDLTQIHLTSRNQLDEKIAEKHLNVLSRNKLARDFYLEKFKGVPAVTFCVSVEHAITLSAYYREAGIRAEAVHAQTTRDERKEIFRKFNAGELDMLCSRDVLIEGWNSKRVTIAFNLRPTYSWVLAEQRACRVVRFLEGKPCGIIVEFQDIYNLKDQHILVHHLFGARTYTQGGYVCAPQRQIKEEREKLAEGKPTFILGEIRVSSQVREVINLSIRSDSKFIDKKLIRDILLSRTDINYSNMRMHTFLGLEFNHPAFCGYGRKLISKHLGVLWQSTKEDYEIFIQDILGEYLFYNLLDPEMEGIEINVEELGEDGDMSIEHMHKYQSLKIDIDRVLSTLTSSERKCIELYFGIGFSAHTYDEISDKSNLTRERVRKKISNAISRMRSSIRADVLRSYMGQESFIGVSEFSKKLLDLPN